jgi:hypothetical protein
MVSDEVKLVFGFEPSGLFENVILAPAMGTPRAPSSAAGDDESDVAAPRSELLGGSAGSVLVIFGIVIFGSDGNCPTAGMVKSDAAATAAMSTNTDLAIKILHGKCNKRFV